MKSLIVLLLAGLLFLPLRFIYPQENYEENQRAQSIISSPVLNNKASIIFDKSYSTYHWNGKVDYESQCSLFWLKLKEEYLSTIIRAEKNFINDEHIFNLSLSKDISTKLQGIARVTSFLWSDNRSLISAQNSSYAFYGGVGYKPIRHLNFVPLMGVRVDKQSNQKDKGLSFLLESNSDSLAISGYLIQLNGTFQYDKLTPRQLEAYNVDCSVEKRFINQTRNKTFLKYYRNRRDFYFPSDSLTKKKFNIVNNIDSRVENTVYLKDTLDYELNSNLLFSFYGDIYTRKINRRMRYQVFSGSQYPSFNTSISEFRVGGGVTAQYYINDNLSASLFLLYQERDETHELFFEPNVDRDVFETRARNENSKNNSSRRTSVGTTVNFRISKFHSLEFSSSSNLLLYDTPSTDNDDDRDELWYILNLKTFHRFSKHLYVNIISEVNLTHLVYLFSSRSADNTWNRVIRLSPRLEYNPIKELTTINIFEVIANYTIYDFELEPSSVRSYVYRQFGFIDSTVIYLTKYLFFNWYSSVRFYEQGEMKWSSFSEKPVNYFEDLMHIGSIKYVKNNGLLFSVGIRYFSQSRFSYNSNSFKLQNRLISVGPIVSIDWNISKRSTFLINGWYENITQSSGLKRSFPNFTLSMFYYI